MAQCRLEMFLPWVAQAAGRDIMTEVLCESARDPRFLVSGRCSLPLQGAGAVVCMKGHEEEWAPYETCVGRQL